MARRTRRPTDAAPVRLVSRRQAAKQARDYRRRADRYREDPQAREQLLRKAGEKAGRAKGPLSGAFEDIGTFIRLVRAYFSREYREVPWESVALILGALLYFLSPIDLIPDFIPVAGYVDDVAVVAWVVQSVKADLERFREWEQRRMTDGGDGEDRVVRVPLRARPPGAAGGAG